MPPNSAQDAPSNLPDGLGTQFSWNYEHVAALWELEGWIDATSAAQAKAHYGAYSVQRQDGLRIMTLNTDFCTFPDFQCGIVRLIIRTIP